LAEIENIRCPTQYRQKHYGLLLGRGLVLGMVVAIAGYSLVE
jgi:hypothetical protein